jgi:signal transduction histidine kinase
VSAEPDDGQWRVAVDDNGIGIEPSQAERIFGMFQRLHSRDAFPGTGIGLAIARKVVEGHGGRIWAEARPEGGTRMAFTLPAQPPA